MKKNVILPVAHGKDIMFNIQHAQIPKGGARRF